MITQHQQQPHTNTSDLIVMASPYVIVATCCCCYRRHLFVVVLLLLLLQLLQLLVHSQLHVETADAGGATESAEDHEQYHDAATAEVGEKVAPSCG